MKSRFFVCSPSLKCISLGPILGLPSIFSAVAGGEQVKLLFSGFDIRQVIFPNAVIISSPLF